MGYWDEFCDIPEKLCGRRRRTIIPKRYAFQANAINIILYFLFSLWYLEKDFMNLFMSFIIKSFWNNTETRDEKKSIFIINLHPGLGR